MNILDHIKIATSSLKSNLFRTFLTTLGIVIGVMSVITMLGVGRGAQQSIEGSFSSFGSNTIYVLPGQSDSAFSAPPGLGDTFDTKQVDTFMLYPSKYIDGIAAMTFGILPVQYKNTDKTTQIIGYYADYIKVFDIKVDRGRLLSQKDGDQFKKVVMVGPDTIDGLFGGDDPLGKKIEIKGEDFLVIGIYKKMGASSFDNNNDDVFMPYQTFNKYMVKQDELPYIAVRAKSAEYIDNAKEETKTIMRRVRNINKGDEDNFSIQDAGELLNSIKMVTGIFTVFLAAVAAISLLVGGIGVMNIMLVSITERTKEIGLRKSLGATNKDILFQFLTESIVVTLIGGSVGMVIGLALSFAISTLAKLEGGIFWDSILLAILFSVVVGFIFGFYPARKAAKLSPIDALRYE